MGLRSALQPQHRPHIEGFGNPPTNPSAMPAAAIADADTVGQFADKKLQDIADEAGINADMVEWWKAQRCVTIKKVAIACTEEKEVRGSVIDAMNASKDGMVK